MPQNRVMLVSLEQDAKYRRDGDRFVEVCRGCGRDREGATCSCGTAFTRLERSFFAASWSPTTLRPDLPSICPHCEGPTTVSRSVTMILPTQRSEQTRWTVEVPSCRRMLPPLLAYLLLVTSVFFLVVFGLALVFGNGLPAAIATGLALAATAASWRAYGWVRFAGFDHRSIRFRVRRRGYALALAAKHGGRIR
jgi:hypothetical protein